MEKKLRKHIREKICKTLNEISTTGDVAGYLTPYAFSGDGGSNVRRVKRMAKMIGYELTKHGKEDAKHIDKLNENYHEFKRDEENSPQKKIAKSIIEARRQIELAEKQISMCSKYQKETKMSGEDFWKMTQKQITKLENRLQKLIEKLREMRG
jgi:5'-3' exonuclease